MNPGRLAECGTFGGSTCEFGGVSGAAVSAVCSFSLTERTFGFFSGEAAAIVPAGEFLTDHHPDIKYTGVEWVLLVLLLNHSNRLLPQGIYSRKTCDEATSTRCPPLVSHSPDSRTMHVGSQHLPVLCWSGLLIIPRLQSDARDTLLRILSSERALAESNDHPQCTLNRRETQDAAYGLTGLGLGCSTNISVEQKEQANCQLQWH